MVVVVVVVVVQHACTLGSQCLLLQLDAERKASENSQVADQVAGKPPPSLHTLITSPHSLHTQHMSYLLYSCRRVGNGISVVLHGAVRGACGCRRVQPS